MMFLLLNQLLFIGILYFSNSSAEPVSTQMAIYDIFKGDKSIGTVQAEKITLSDGSQRYLLESEVAFSFLGRHTLRYTFNTHYQKGLLTFAEAKNLLNQKLRDSSRVQWDGHRYLINTDGSQSVLENTPISYSVSSMYYLEPDGVSQAFSERFAQFCPIRKLAPGKYELTMPDGRKNIYYYEKGVCQRVEVSMMLADLVIKRRS